ncbi:hypothetical protein VCR8J2_50017 [Vibrio coralliirubri]|nr:hypothetical protein VCR8J2_50017 [Vibrio coralliirubri]
MTCRYLLYNVKRARQLLTDLQVSAINSYLSRAYSVEFER